MYCFLKSACEILYRMRMAAKKSNGFENISFLEETIYFSELGSDRQLNRCWALCGTIWTADIVL